MIRAALAPLLLGLAALGGCGPDPELRVDGGWVRLSPVPDRPAAVYFTIHGGPQDAHLLSIVTPVAIRTELHETMKQGAMSQMAPLDGLDIPANAEIKFAPGGKHAMLFHLNPGIKPGDKVPLTFTFTNGERIEYDALVVATGDAGAADGKKTS